MKLAQAAVAAVGVGLGTQAAFAEVSLSTQAPAKVEVGQRFTVQLTALGNGGDDTPSQPKLPVPPSFSVQGPSVSTQYQMTTVNGRFEQHQGITASWILMSNSVGRFRIGPGSVISGGHQVADRPFVVEVVAAGTLPQQRQGRRGRPNPFDPFGFDWDPFSSPMLPPMRGMPQLGMPDQDQQLNSWPRELDIAQARDPTAFLDARATPKKVVIGQQVTFSVFAYGHAVPFELGSMNEPNLRDFLSYDLMEDGATRETPMRIGDDIWYAQKLRERALFPLHAGHLRIGAMRAQFRGLQPQSPYNNAFRQSQVLDIVVVEPPITGRPSGYRLGDVGQFNLSASVDPREIKANEAIAVNLELSGTGNLPQHLDLPEQKGAEWLEPTTSESIGHQGGKVGGKRNWQYVVKLHEAGTIDLGKISLRYYDPERGQYAYATADLGQVVVRPGEKPAEADKTAPSNDTLAQSLMPRDQLGAVPEPKRYWADARYFWALTLIGPFGVAAGIAARSLGALGFGFWSRRRDSVKRRTQEQLQAARSLLSGADAAGAASAIERALYMAIEAATGLRARGVVRNELTHELTKAGLTDAEASTTVRVFDACDTTRFTGADPAHLAEVLEQAESLSLELCRRAQSNPRGQA